VSPIHQLCEHLLKSLEPNLKVSSTIQPSNNYLLHIYYVPDTLLSVITFLSRAEKVFALIDLWLCWKRYVLMREAHQ
jgi:hypothetical protein